MSMPTFGQLSFTATGHLLIAETAIEFQRTTIAIKAEIPNENHALRSARILLLEQAAFVIRHELNQEQLRQQPELLAAPAHRLTA
ncbi:MAG: hypothetical protein V7606_2755 [Burkholderiales bacterium]|jgi:hypothetical protein|nr:hypothetical protein [Burkholderia sp.]